MSRTVDERVVSMQFDNKKFEANVKTSMSTLDKLKQKLNFHDTSKSLDALSQAARKVDMTRLGDGVNKVGLQFSAMYTIADQVLRNITTRVQQTAERMAKAFTLDPIKSGLSEYETQIGAVQTILANTSSKGTTLLEVNAALDELNKYADMTIYNFTEMTRNIGTFTAAGVGLEQATNAIKGIANLAAVSGSSSQQASTAMYQLSQALAAGRVSLMDWNSVVNAGMGGQLFQDALKRTARQQGHDVDKLIEKYGSFRESLTQGEWLTTEVLTETLAQLSGAYTEADLIAQGYTQSQAEEIVKLSETAVNAATKVKTLTQLFDTLKEALQSGWTQSWEIIIGDFEEAKALWTAVSDTVGNIINKSSDQRNQLLSGALDTNWEKLIKNVNEAGIETATFEERTKTVLKEHGYDVEALIEKYGSLENIFREGVVSSDLLHESLEGIGKTAAAIDMSGIGRTLTKGMRGDDVKLMQEALEYLDFDVGEFGIDGSFGPDTERALKAFQEANGIEPSGILDEETLALLEKRMTTTSESAGLLGETCKDLIDGIEELGGRELLIEGLKNAFVGLLNFLRPVGEAFSSVFKGLSSEQLFGYIKGFHDLAAKFRLLAEQEKFRTMIANIKSTFAGLFSIIDIVARVIGGALVAGFKTLGKVLGAIAPGFFEITGSMGEAIVKFREWLLEEGRISGIFSALGNAVKIGVGAIKEWVKAFLEIPAVQKVISRFKEIFSETFGGAYERIKAFIDRIKEMDGISLDNLGAILTDFKENVLSYFFNLDNPFGKIKDAIVEFWNNITKHFGSIEGKFSGLRETIVNFFTIVKEKIGDNMGSIIAIGVILTFLYLVKKIKDAVELLAKPFGAVEDLCGSIGGAFDAFKKSIKSKSIQAIATSIATLAAAVAVLAMLPQDKVWSSVGAIVALAATLVIVSKVMSKVDNIQDFGKVSLSLAGLGAALLMVAFAAKVLESVSPAGIVKTIVLIGALVGSLVLMSKFNTSGGTFLGFGQTIMQLSFALMLLGGAIAILGNMELNTLLQGGGAVLVFFGMMVGMMAATKLLAKELPRFGTTMTALSFSLLLMTAAVAILGNMELGTLVQGGIFVTAFFGLMVLIMKATQLIAKDLPRFGATMLGLSASLLIMGLAVGVLAKIDPETFVKGSIVLTGLIGLMALMMYATRALSKDLVNGAKIGTMMMSFAVSILILVGAIALLSVIDADKIFTAVTALAAITIMMSGLMVATKYAGSEIKGIIGLAIGVGILAAAVAALSFIEPSKLYAATGALSIIMGMMAVLIAATHFMKAGMKSVVALAGIIVILSGSLILLSYLKVEDALANAAALSILVLAISGAAMMLMAVNIAGALMAVASFAVLVLGLTAVLALVGGIAQIPGMDWIISEGGNFLQKVGYAIGQFFGGIAGGAIAGTASGLPALGTSLSEFMTNAEGFFNGIGKLDETAVTAIENLATMVFKITAANFLDAVTSFLTGGSDIVSFATKLTSFGEKLSEFSDAISDLDDKDLDQMTKVAEAVDGLVDISTRVPKTGGWAQTILGVPSLTYFAAGLKQLAPALVEFSTAFADVKQSTIDKMGTVATATQGLVDIANNVPPMGGLLQNILGVPSLTTFATSLKPLGDGITSFVTATSTITDTDIAKITSIGTAADALVTVAGKVPPTGGIKQAILGAPDFSSFALELVHFGSALASFNRTTKHITTEDIDKITDIGTAADKLAGVAKKVNEYKDREWLNTSLSEFATELIGEDGGTGFGSAMSTFSSSIASVDAENIGVVVTKARSIMRLAQDLNGVDTGVLYTFGCNAEDFGECIGNMYSYISTVDMTQLSSAITQVRRLKKLSDDMNGATFDFSFLEGVDEQFGNIGGEGVTKFVEAFEQAADTAATTGKTFISNLVKGMREASSKVDITALSITVDIIATLRSSYVKFYSAGVFLAAGFASGVSAGKSKVVSAAVAIASAAIIALKTALLIKSPSRVTYGLGEYFGTGFVNGIDAYANKSYDAGASIAENARSGLTNAISSIGTFLEEGIDTQPTIRPVLDLSDVTSGAGVIDGMFSMRPAVGVMANVGSISSMMNSSQNGANSDVVSAIEALGKTIGGRTGDTYQINGVTYDDGSNITDAVKTLVRAAKVERRI